MVKRTRHAALGFAALGLIALCIVSAGSLAQAQSATVQSIPNPRSSGGWVYDGAGLIGTRVDDINAHISELERDTGVEIGVVTLESIGAEAPKAFAVELFAHWGIGKKGEDNGILVLHVVDQRRVEIEIGYGLEASLTDAQSKWIIDDVTIPFFKKGAFADGHYETVRALSRGARAPGLNRSALTSELETPIPSHAAPATTPAPLSSAHGPPRPDPPLIRRHRWSTQAFLMMGFSGGFWLVWMLVFVLVIRKQDPLEAWETYKGARFFEYPALAVFGAGLGLCLAPKAIPVLVICAVACAALGWIWRTPILRHLRSKPRLCTKCGSVCVLLSESEDDAHLESGQQTEERIGSVDYDVWSCEPCDWVRIDPYRVGHHSKCSACGYRTESTSSTVVQAATYTSTGQRRVTVSCAHCGRSSTSYHIIPMKERPKPSSSSSSGFSSGGGGFSSGGGGGGGSWGGGSSGGGGAGGSY